jgi:hypothetical protein
VSRQTLRGIAEQFQQCSKIGSRKRNIPIPDAPKGGRDDFVDPYFKGEKPIPLWSFSSHTNRRAS